MPDTKIPTYDEFIEPLLRVLAEHPEGLTAQAASDAVAVRENLSPEERAALVPSGRQPAYKNRIGWAHDALKRARLSHSPKFGVWCLTAGGVAYAAQYPVLTQEQVRELARGFADRPATPSGDEGDLPLPGSDRGRGVVPHATSVQQANVLALNVVRKILTAAAPAELTINGAQVTLTEQPNQPTPSWPNIPTLSESESAPWPTPRVWEASWESGGCTLTLAAVKSSASKDAPKGVGIRLASNDRELIWIDVAAYIRRPSTSDYQSIPADFALKKRVPNRADNQNTPMTQALAQLLAEHGIESVRSSIEAWKIRKDTGDFEPAPEIVLHRLLVLGLLKLDFFHSRPDLVEERGKPLINLEQLGFSTLHTAVAEAADAPAADTPDDYPPRNLILFGPPGTGKTYEIQLEYEPRFQADDKQNSRFITFHQSYTYEDFIEGIRPAVDDEDRSLRYELKRGVFYECAVTALELAGFEQGMDAFCRLQAEEREEYFSAAPRYALFIDEINRGNVSRVFGELITLLEVDKRLGEKNELIVELPYSHTLFGVPPNLHLIGTMNTADRSVEALDTALRRRFQFLELPPKPTLLNFEIEGVRINSVLSSINARIEKLLDRDHALGHAYFMRLKDMDATLDDLKDVFKTAILPLLQEYFFGDFGRIGLILGPSFVKRVEAKTVPFADFDHEDSEALADRTLYTFANIDELTAADFRSIYRNAHDRGV